MSLNYTFCTIVTSDFIPIAKSLSESIKQFNKQIELHVLVVDAHHDADPREGNFHTLKEISNVEFFHEIEKKYSKKHKKDKFRWSLKPVFINHLLSEGFEKVIFIDPDLYFFNDFTFLFDDLNNYNVLLSPHWRSLDPNVDRRDFTRNYSNGLFNGGLVGFNKKAINSVLWWAKMCSYACEIDLKKGLYVDQGYLTLLPLIEENTKIIHHRGCNVASWNDIENQRVEINGEVYINGKYPIIFIHFSNKIFERAAKGIDNTLDKCIISYCKSLLRHGAELSKYQKQLINNHEKNNN